MENGRELVDENLFDTETRKYQERLVLKMKKVVEYAAFIRDKSNGKYEVIVSPKESLMLVKRLLTEYLKLLPDRWDTKDTIIKKRVVETYTGDWDNVSDTDCCESGKKRDDFAHTPRQMAEKLIEFQRGFTDGWDDEKAISDETKCLEKLFCELQKSEEFEILAYHLDDMFCSSVFNI